MRVLVTGAAGQVGQDFQQVLSGVVPLGGSSTARLGASSVVPGEFDVIPCGREQIDVTDQAQVDAFVEANKPDAIVHLAAYTAVGKAETDQQGARRLNVDATRFIAQAAEAAQAHMIYISTDYVFAGDLGRALVESDVTNPLSVYGATKLAGEQVLSDSATIVRTSWVAGLRGKNLFHLAAAAGKDGRELKFVDDQVGTPTNAADLAAGLVAFLRERPAGIFHVAGSGQASWFDAISFAVGVAGGSSNQVSAISTDQLDPPPIVTRPAFSPLFSERLGSVGLIPLPDWHDGVERLVRAIQENQAGTLA